MQSTTQREDRRYLYATLVGSLVLLAYPLLLPLDFDDMIYRSMAKELVDFHWLPYVNSWDQNFPGIVYLHAVSLVLFGSSAFAFHLFDLVVHVATSWMLFALVRRWLTPRMSLMAVLFYNFHYISSTAIGQRDAYAACFLVAGTLLLMRDHDRQQTQPAQTAHDILVPFMAGAAFAMMFVLRGTYGTYLVIAFVYLFIHRQHRLLRSVAFIAGVCTVVFAVLLPYLLTRGALYEVYLALFRFNLELYGQARSPLSDLFKQFWSQKFFLIFPLWGVLVLSIRSWRGRSLHRVLGELKPIERSDRWLAAAFAAAGLLSDLVMGKYFGYHIEVVMLVAAPFGAIGIQEFIALFQARMHKFVVVTALLLYCIFRVAPLPLIREYGAALRHGSNPVQVAYDLNSEPGYPISADHAIASYIDRTAPLGARIESASWNAGVRLLSPRKSTTRFTTFYALACAKSDRTHPDFQQAWRREFVDSIRYVRPCYLLLSNVRGDDFGIPVSPMYCVQGFPGFDSLIIPHYRYDTTIGGYTLFRRRD